MRETPLSICEKDFILKNISQHRRLDGRKTYDYRNVRISFGVTFGCCHVQLGDTRVLAQVSCEVGQPKPSKASEGVLFVNVELSAMASPAFEGGRQTDESVELSRLMERCLKESRCVDLESLCIVSGEKVWLLRVDIHVLNHEGNVLDCASIAAMSALAHFRRPDVTVKGEEITIHSFDERNPVSLSIHHMPLLVSFAFFSQGQYMLIDPSEKEEKVMEGKMVIGMNKYREICTLQVTGQMLMMKDQVLRCSNIAVLKVTRMTDFIHEALQNDKDARKRGEKHGFAELISKEKVSAHQKDKTEISVSSDDDDDAASLEEECSDMEDGDGVAATAEKDGGEHKGAKKSKQQRVKILTKGVGMIGEGGTSQWLNLKTDGDEKMEMDDSNKVDKSAAAKRKAMKRPAGNDDDSEEEEQVTMQNSSDWTEGKGKMVKDEDSEEEEQVVILS